MKAMGHEKVSEKRRGMAVMRNKILAFFFIAVICVSFLPNPAWAGEPPEEDAWAGYNRNLTGLPEVAGPGWHMASADPVAPDKACEILFSQQEAKRALGAQRFVMELAASETEATPEIHALARALQNNPNLIFDYVHNYIDYVPTFGSANGATVTLLAGRGNDWDQTSLFIALMRAAGYTADYVVGDAVYEVSRLANLVGVEDDINVVGNVFASGGVPVEGSISPPGLKITRVWAEAVIDGETYIFDPAMKEYENITGIDLATAISYDQATFMANAQNGTEVTNDYVRNMNETNIRADLVGYSTNLVNYIKNNMSNAKMAEVISGRRIVSIEMTAYPTSLPYAVSVSNKTTYTEIPDAYRHTMRMQHEGIDHIFNTFQIAGKRVSIFYRAGDNAPELRVDGELVATGNSTTAGTRYDMTLTVDHPYAAGGGTFADQQGTFKLKSGSSYVIVHDFNGASSDLIARRNGLLAKYHHDGYIVTSEPVLGESLWVMGLTWVHEENLFSDLVDRLGKVISLCHHRAGVMGQEEGYYIDMPMNFVSIVSTDGASDTWPAFRAQTMMGSAFEHGVLEQLQGSDKPAVSTIKLLQISNSNSRKTFMANASNWATVKPQLLNYSASTLDMIEFYINNSHEFVLPEDAHITLNEWRGVGYIDDYQSDSSGSMGMIISGGYYGGYGGTPGDVNSEKVQEQTEEGNQPANKKGDVETPEDKDPIDMATGAFLYENADISIGGPEPMGLSFIRYYSSGGKYSLEPLGYGWSHNYAIFLRPHSDGGPGLGQRQPTDAASMVTYAYVSLDLLKNQRNIRGWTITSLAAKWAMDQLIDNAVSVHIGPKVFEYIKLANETYNPPPGIRRDLVQSGSNFSLQGEFNDCLIFDAEGKITTWKDTNNNTMTFAYDGNGMLQTITDGFGRTLTFAYSGDRLASVTDFAGRSISFEYTDNNLTTHRDAENNTWSYGYDSEHRMSSVINPLTNVVVTNVYDDQGRVEAQADALDNTTNFYFSGFRNILKNPDGNQIVFYLDDEGRMISQQDALGHRYYFVYNGQGHLVSLTDRLGETTGFTYHDESGKIASITNAKGHTINYTYTVQDQTFTNPNSSEQFNFIFYNLNRIEYLDGTYEEFTYDDEGNMLTRKDRAGKTWQYEYNSQGQVTKITNPAGGVTNYTYAGGTLASSKDSDTGVTTYGYDAYNRLNRITHPDSTFSQIAYNANDQVTSVTDERGKTTTYEYDANDNLIKVTDPAGSETQYGYDLMDRVVQVTDRLGKNTDMTYDNMGHLASITNPNGIATSFSYDLRGWLNQITHGGQTWHSAYDDEGVVSSRTTPLGYTTTYQTDKLGYTTGITDPLNMTNTFTRDVMSRITKIADPLSRETRYGYDSRGLLSSVTKPVIGSATYTRNDLGLLSLIPDLNGQNWTFRYTNMGRLQSRTDPLSNIWQYIHDTRGRLKQTSYPDGATQTRTYDDAGNIVRRLYSDGTDLQFTYDELNRLLTANNLTLTRDAESRITNTKNSATNFGATYDDGGRLKTVTYNNGAFTITYSYDDTTGLLSRVTDSLTGTQIDFTYNNDTKLTGITRSNAVNTTFTWDNASRLTRIQDGSIIDIQYTLDAAGQVTQADMNVPLNPADLLTSDTDTFTYDAASQVSTAAYSYDARGRLTDSPGHTYTWDGASRLTGIDGVTLTYNGMGDLITRTEGGTTTHYYYNYAIGLKPIVAEKDEGTGEFLRYYVWTPDGNLLYMIDAANDNRVYFYHFDRTSSTLALTDASGTVTDSWAYTPYGVLLAHKGTNDQPFTFVGKYGVKQEGNLGLYHMRARYYDAITGSFITRDPLRPIITNPKELNPYQYVGRDPVNFVDPKGESKKEINKNPKTFEELKAAIIAAVKNDPECVRRIDSLLSYPLPDSWGMAGSLRNIPNMVFFYVRVWLQGNKKAVDSDAYKELCGGIAEAAVKTIRKAGVEWKGNKLEVRQVKRDRVAQHYAVKVKIGDDNWIVFDWHQTLNIDNPVIQSESKWKFSNVPTTAPVARPYSAEPPGSYIGPYGSGGYDVTRTGQRMYH